MFKPMTGFLKTMLMVFPRPWKIWVAALMFLNMVAPLMFIEHREAQVVLLATMIAAGVQMTIFRSKGFVRLLGIGHLTWVPVVVWLGSGLGAVGTDSLFGKWLLAVIVFDGLSLVIDAVDVGRYVSGDREPAATFDIA